jgi:diadenosine tetraphosphate (Ap4A) HIT family hydrolase
MSSPAFCPFCAMPPGRVLVERPTAYLVRDAFPVSPGHSLAIPKRHLPSWFEATKQEQTDLMSLLDDARRLATSEFAPDSFNIGINDGAAAGQTVPHLHVHLIPRFRGDVTDPRGGVRWVIPEKADYWSERLRS